MKFLIYLMSLSFIACGFESRAAESTISVNATPVHLKKGIPKEVVFEIKNHSEKFICIVEQDVPTNPKYPTVGLYGKNNTFIKQKNEQSNG